MTNPAITEQELQALGEEFVYRMRQGVTPTIEEYSTRFSSPVREEVAEFLESIQMLEELKEPADRGELPINPPAEFGRYFIESVLGEGGMGAVYMATDTQLHRKVAIKTPKFNSSSKRSFIDRFYREARAAATLQHPNICPVYDVGQHDGTHYISMALINGRRLSDLVRSDSRIAIGQAIRIVRKIALAIHEAHSQGLVHRDLKPGNVMIDHRGEPIVMDFGLALHFDEPDSFERTNLTPDALAERIEDRLTQDGTILGSPGYMAPEQLRCGSAGPTSDIYALGVLLFELLTGRLPHSNNGSLRELLRSIVEDDTPDVRTFRPDANEALANVCRQALEHAPEKRFQSMKAFSDALAAAGNGRNHGAHPSANDHSTTTRVPLQKETSVGRHGNMAGNSPTARARRRRRKTISGVKIGIALTVLIAVPLLAISMAEQLGPFAPASEQASNESQPRTSGSGLQQPTVPESSASRPTGERLMSASNDRRFSPEIRIWRLDSDGSGTLSKSELLAARPAAGQLGQRIHDSFDLFDTMPTDGQLDRQEVGRFIRAMAKLNMRGEFRRPPSGRSGDSN